MARIFISHSSEDRAQARQLLEWLHSQGFASTFLDFDEKKGIPPGADWERTLYREIAACDAVIAILTKNSFKSKWCFVEYAQARALGKEIIPIVETPEGKTFVSRAIQHLDLVQDRNGGLERLRAELTRIVNIHPTFAWDAARPPFPGLMAFDEADAAIYFGRDDDIGRLIERLNAHSAQGIEKLVVVLGASGSGKSSLVRAGLLPRLKSKPHDWIVLPPFRPRLNPIEVLAQAIAAALGTPTQWREWRTALEGDDLGRVFSDLCHDLRAAHAQNEAHILLTIDQGEELFGGDEKDRQQAARFFTVLSAMLEERLPFLAVMTLRSDYLDRLQLTPQLTAPFDEFSLKPMPLERIRAIIEGPAKIAGIAVEEELIAEARSDAKTDDALPLLAFALRELYDRSAGSGRMTVEAYRALGDAQARLSPLENAVRRKADEVLKAARPSAEDLQALKEAFIPAMVWVDTKGDYVRKPANRAVLPERALPLIERLAKAYLLIVRSEPAGTVIEVAHEALLRNWPLLRGWLDEEREFLIGKNQLEQDLRDWQHAPGKQKTEALLWGLKLARAQEWLTTKPHQLNADEKRFIETSVQYAAQRRRARMVRTVGTLVAGICLVLGSVIVYQVKERQAAQAEEASALGFSASEMERNQPVSLAFLADALRHDPKNQSAIALAIAELRDAELPLQTLRPDEQKGGEMEDAEFSPDGTLLVTASADHTARIWNAKSGQPVGKPLQHGALVRTAEFDRSGNLIVTASYDGFVGVWDAHTGAKLYMLPPTGKIAAKVYTAHFDRDAKTIVASYDDGVRVWDTATRQQVGWIPTRDSAWDAVFDPAAYRRIVSASEDGSVQVWDPSMKQPDFLEQGNGKDDVAAVSAVAVSSDGNWIAAATDNGKTGAGRAWVWNAHTLRPACPGPLQHADGVNSVSFNPGPASNAATLVTASRDGTARLWNLPSCKPVGEPMHHAGWVRSAVFSGDGRWVLTASYDRSARVWDAATGLAVSPPMRHGGAIYAAHFDSGDPHLVVTASFDGSARVWRWRTRPALLTIPTPNSAKAADEGKILEAACWDSGANDILTVSDTTVQLWDLSGAEPSSRILPVAQPVTAAACSNDAQWLVTVSGSTAQIWNVAAAAPAASLNLAGAQTDPAAGASLRFDPKDRWLALISAQQVRLFDVKTGASVLSSPIRADGDLVGATFSPDGERIATFTKTGSVRVWNLPAGAPVEAAPMVHTAKAVSAAFSPDGQRLVTASADHTARVWNVATGAELARLQLDHWGTDAAFSPDGNWIVTACADFTAQVWNARTYKPSGPLLRQAAEITHVEFSPDQRWVLTYAADGTAQAWGAINGIPVTEPMKSLQPDTLHLAGAHFSADGRWIIAFASEATSDSGGRGWQLQMEEAPITGSVAPAWLIALAEGAGGLAVDANGGIVRAPDSADPVVLEKTLNNLQATDPVSQFGRWLVADPDTRPRFPQAER